MKGDAGRVMMSLRAESVAESRAMGWRAAVAEISGFEQPARRESRVVTGFRPQRARDRFPRGEGHILQHAETSGAAQITTRQTSDAKGGAARTVVRGQFDGEFTTVKGKNHLAFSMALLCRFVSSTPGRPTASAPSDSVDARVAAAGHRIDHQQGSFFNRRAAAREAHAGLGNSARLYPADQIWCSAKVRGWSTGR